MLACMTHWCLIYLLYMRYCQGYKAMIVPCMAHYTLALYTWVNILAVHCQSLGLDLLQQLCIESLHMAAAP